MSAILGIVQGVACGLAEMETICLQSSSCFIESAGKRFQESYLCFRSAVNHMADIAISKSLPRWRMRPKIHYLEHATFDFNGKKLRFMSNYLDEDMIRRVKRMAVAATPRYA